MSIVLVETPVPLQEAERAAVARLGLPLVTATPESLAETLRQGRARLVLVSERCEAIGALCRAVREAAGGAQVPILLVCEDEGPDAQARARAFGADGIVARPLSRARLARRLRAYLGGGAGGVESRHDARVPVRVPLLFGLSEPDLTGYLYNLSRSGLYLMSDRIFPPGTVLQLRLQLPNSRREFAGTGRVVWANREEEGGAPPAPARPPGMGVEFVELPPDTRSLIDLLVARLCRQGYAVS